MDVYNFNIGDEPYEVKIISLKKKKAEVEVNGILYKVDIGDMGYLPFVVPQVIAQQAPQRPASTVSAPRTAPKPVKQAAGSGDIASPMPGIVVKVLVSPGDEVSAGDVVVIIEAMKMENQIKAAAGGTVGSVHVNQGDHIAEGQLLVSLGGV